MTYPTFETKVGFDRIKKLLIHYCYSELGQVHVESLYPETDLSLIDEWTGQTDEFLTLINSDLEFPSDAYFYLTPALQKVKIPGARFELDEAWQLKLSLDTLNSIQKFIRKLNEELFPHLVQLGNQLVLHPFVSDKLNRIFNRQGKVIDSASPELAEIRRLSHSKQQSVQKRIHQILKQARSEGIVEPDTELTLREGRLVIPVPSSYKRKIPGIVHDESATGKTAYVEPGELFEINNEIRELQLAEQREIVRILHELSDYVRPYIDDLLEAFRLLGLFDFIRAKALLAKSIGAIKPRITPSKHFSWKNAVHPLLFLTLKKEKKKTVPLDIELQSGEQLLLISGPNAGGKSVCLKTVGLLQYMAQCGLLVPVAEESVFGLFEKFFIDIGDEQSIENDLSTYSSHLTNLKNMLRNANENTLILIDELGGGTEPLLGGAIAEAILEQFLELKVSGVVTTHYTNLKHFALSTPGIVNAAMLYDQNRMEPLFQLSIGKPGSSFAFEIARKIGLPEKIIQSASQKIGQDHVNFDKILKEVARDKKYWEKKRKAIRAEEKRFLEVNKFYQDELALIERERKRILNASKEEAGKLVMDVNKRIENTIREIREAQAEKEKTRQLRQELEQFKKQLTSGADDPANSSPRLKEFKEREQKWKEKIPGKLRKQLVQEKSKPDSERALQVGDYVRLKGETTLGEIIELNEKNLVVAFGNLMTSIPRSKVERVSKNEAKKQLKQGGKPAAKLGWNLAERRLNFSHTLDVRGERLDDAIQKLALYLDECMTLNVPEVKILHGTGNGILRKHLREYIRAMGVASWLGDEAIELGGAGITVIKF